MRKTQRFWGGVGIAVAVTLAVPLAGQALEDDLAQMDLEDLMNVEVTTVSKRSTKMSESPAAVFVISAEDIRRSGATTVPELLRRVPGVHVARIDGSRWAISARGFNDEFSNKLLVMIDGRSIYTPLFSGVIWNEHDLMLEDVERIEVVRGPGGTVWGANAVNGVINIITKKARDTQGLLATALAGDVETFTGAARWGGAAGDAVHYRVYGKFADRDDLKHPDRAGPAHDAWESLRAGGRIDWQLGDADLLTLQGDFLDSDADRATPSGLEDKSEASGGNVLARYSHDFSATSDLSLQLYYHHIERRSDGFREDRDTIDVDFQHSFAPLARNQIVWGAGYRLTMDRIEGVPSFNFLGRRQKDHLASFFVQDEIELVEDRLALTIGSKFEHNDYTGFEYQPSGRLMWTPHAQHSFWAAVSRAVRTPSRSDEDLIIVSQLSPFLVSSFAGSSDYDSEEVIAYEIGYRTQPIDSVSFDVAGFYNQYDDLRSVEFVSTTFPPLTWNSTLDNKLRGEGYGAEVATSWAVSEYLILSGTYTFTRNDLTDKTGRSGFPIGGVEGASESLAETRTPRHQFHVGSRVNLPWNLELDASLGWTERLRGTSIGDYTRLDLRLGWRPLESLELALVGQNLIEEQEQFPASFLTQSSEIPRSFYGSVTWRFR